MQLAATLIRALITDVTTGKASQTRERPPPPDAD